MRNLVELKAEPMWVGIGRLIVAIPRNCVRGMVEFGSDRGDLGTLAAPMGVAVLRLFVAGFRNCGRPATGFPWLGRSFGSRTITGWRPVYARRALLSE